MVSSNALHCFNSRYHSQEPSYNHEVQFTSAHVKCLLSQLLCIMSKYSSLMDYLDAQDPDCSRKESKQPPLPSQYRNSSSESSISSNPGSPPGYSSRKQYVWDEVESSRPQNRLIEDGTSSSVSSARTKTSAYRGDNNQSSSQDGTTVSEMIQAVRSKVDAMKIELRNRCDLVRELQTELARVRNAKERREEKYKKLWESRLSDLTEEQSKMLKRQTDFLEKLAVDTKSLFEKDSALREKIRIGESNSASTMHRISQDGQRKKERNRNQWISDEKVSFEKVLASKMESMKTQAAKSMGLRLDATVSEYRETALRASEDIDSKLVQLKSALQAEFLVKNAEAIQKLRDERAEDDDRQKRLEERKLEEARRRQESEILALKEKFTRNRNVLEEKLERTRRDESSSASSGLVRAREEGSRQLREASESHQRALAALLRSNSEARVSQERELREQADQWECAYRKEAKENQAIMRKRARDLLTAKTAAETEKIIQRLRAEVEEDRDRTRKSLEKEAEDIRSQAQIAVDVVRSTEIRSACTPQSVI
jgi:hypothetical protein